MPQGSVLGPILFLIFVNDIDAVVSSHIQEFADDCKVYRSVPTAEDIDKLQQDINNVCQWSKDWQMLFNVKKCKVLHIGHNNAYCDYSMNGEILQSVTEETDLGTIVSNDLKVSNGAKIRTRYNQVPHLTQDTNGKVTNSQKTPQTRAKRSALSQQVTTKHI